MPVFFNVRQVVDGQAYVWPFFVFTLKHDFGPRTAKCQPIWIKFCTPIVIWNTLVPC